MKPMTGLFYLSTFLEIASSKRISHLYKQCLLINGNFKISHNVTLFGDIKWQAQLEENIIAPHAPNVKNYSLERSWITGNVILADGDGLLKKTCIKIKGKIAGIGLPHSNLRQFLTLS
jgi:hypothetical protein